MYRAFFGLRFLVELIKLFVVLNIWVSDRIFLDKFELNFEDKNVLEFIIAVAANGILTILTFVWTLYRMCGALDARRRNMSM